MLRYVNNSTKMFHVKQKKRSVRNVEICNTSRARDEEK